MVILDSFSNVNALLIGHVWLVGYWLVVGRLVGSMEQASTYPLRDPPGPVWEGVSIVGGGYIICKTIDGKKRTSAINSRRLPT